MTLLDLFSGIGGFSLAAEWTGEIRTVGFSEIDPYCCKVLAKNFPGVPIHGDIRELKPWEIGGGEECYNATCVLQNSEKPLSDTLRSLKRQIEDVGSAGLATNAETGCPLLRALLEGEGASAPENADMNSCGERRPQTPMAGNGCEEKETRIGSTGEGTTAGTFATTPGHCDGEGGSSPEIGIPVGNAGKPRWGEIGLGRTTSSHGQNSRNCDIESATGEQPVSNATKGFMPCGQRRGIIDIISAGVPCQPASVAGKCEGSKDDRWLWPETFRVIREVRPKWVILENVPGLLALEGGLEFEKLLLELEDQGYSVVPLVIPACGVGAPHLRYRVWLVANTERRGCGEEGECRRLASSDVADALGPGHEPGRLHPRSRKPGSKETVTTRCREEDAIRNPIGGGCSREPWRGTGPFPPDGYSRMERGDVADTEVGTVRAGLCQGGATGVGRGRFGDRHRPGIFWLPEPDVGRVAHGVPARVDRLRALGNAIVPQVAYQIFKAMVEAGGESSVTPAMAGLLK